MNYYLLGYLAFVTLFYGCINLCLVKENRKL
jgi:hypothetical protein